MWGLPSSSTLYPGRNSLSWPLALGDTAEGSGAPAVLGVPGCSPCSTGSITVPGRDGRGRGVAVTCRCLLHLKPPGSCPCCAHGVSWGISLGGPACLGWGTELGPLQPPQLAELAGWGHRGIAHPGVQPQVHLCTRRHSHTTTHGTDVPCTDRHGHLLLPPPRTSSQVCTDLHVCPQQHMDTDARTPAHPDVHTRDVWVCMQGHSCTCVRTPKSTCTHAHVVQPHPCPHTGGPCAHAPPKKACT